MGGSQKSRQKDLWNQSYYCRIFGKIRFAPGVSQGYERFEERSYRALATVTQVEIMKAWLGSGRENGEKGMSMGTGFGAESTSCG